MTQACSTPLYSDLSVMWKTVSNYCNMTCKYCYFNGTADKKPEEIRIPNSILEKFIKEYMQAINGVAAMMWQGGEPMLAGLDFFQKVVSLQGTYAKPNTTISNSIQTNGTLITDQWAEFFKQYDFLVGVSIDGPREIHDKNRIMGKGGKGTFDVIMKGVDILRKHNVDFNILTVLSEDNVEKAEELMSFYHTEGFDFVQFIPCMDFKAQEAEKRPVYKITAQQYGQFLCEAFDVWYNEAKPKISVRFFDNLLLAYLGREQEMCTHRTTCPKTIILEQNGDAFPCDFYMSKEWKIGNIKENTLAEILNHENYKRFMALKPNLPEQCKNCEYLHLCYGGCPRNRVWCLTEIEADVFCHSYKMIYCHSEEKLKRVATKVRMNWINNHLKSGNPLPNRNEKCLCGSGRKFKQCCGTLID